jgi:hypothetical protein
VGFIQTPVSKSKRASPKKKKVYHERWDLKKTLRSGVLIIAVIVLVESILESLWPSFAYGKPFYLNFGPDPILLVRLLFIALTPSIIGYGHRIINAAIQHIESRGRRSADRRISLDDLHSFKEEVDSIIDRRSIEYLFGASFLLSYSISVQFLPTLFPTVDLLPMPFKLALYPAISYPWAFVIGVMFYLFVRLVWTSSKWVYWIGRKKVHIIPIASVDPVALDGMGGYRRMGRLMLYFYMLTIIVGSLALTSTTLFSSSSSALAVFGSAFYFFAALVIVVAVLGSILLPYAVHVSISDAKDKLSQKYAPLIKQMDDEIVSACRNGRSRSAIPKATLLLSLQTSYSEIKNLKTWVFGAGELWTSIAISMLSYVLNLILRLGGTTIG